MSSYPDFHAELYDLFYQDKPYPEETKFLDTIIKKHNPGAKKILELACGTGKHALILEKCGYQISAIDYSLDMITVAKRKKEQANSNIIFTHGNMCDLSLVSDSFDVTMCLFDSIGYLRSNESILSTFKQVYNHLNPGGIFIVEYWNAFAMSGHYEPMRKKVFYLPDQTIIRLSETRIDYETQLASVNYTIIKLQKSGSYTEFHEEQINRFFSPQEMILFGITSGFEVNKQYSGYSETVQIDDKSWHIIIVFKKPLNK